MMACFLCLETAINTETAIQIFSEEGKSLSVKNIILKHLWMKPNENELDQWICRQCWNSLSSFHEFYMRIVRAHENLQQITEYGNPIDPISSKIENTTQPENISVKIEEDLINAEIVVTKRKRGRPKSIKPYDVLEEIPIDTESRTLENLNVEDFNGLDMLSKEYSNADDNVCETKTSIIEDEEINDAPPKRRKARSRRLTKTKKKKIKIQSDFEIKTELQLDEITDADLDMQMADISNKDSHDESDEECTKRDSKKIYTERKNLSLEYDDFIAKNFKLVCCLCQSPLQNFSQLKVHFRTEHKIRGYALCCGKKLIKRGVLVDHIHTHLDPEYFKCSKCGKIMSDRRCLEGHMKTHEIRGQPAFKCEHCSKSFHRRVVYLRHIQNHLPEDMKKFECPECAKKFATYYLMNQHHKIVHLNTYSKICDICGKRIHGRDALQRHQSLHDNVPPPPIQCDLCGLTLTTKYGLTRHMKAKHIADYQQPQVCPYCSKVSPNFFAQKRHIYYMHNIERRHACPMCEKAFKRSKDLREHMTTHTGDVLYTCLYCPKTFNSDANMYAHRKKVHRKEWEETMRKKFPLVHVKEEVGNAISQNDQRNEFFATETL